MDSSRSLEAMRSSAALRSVMSKPVPTTPVTLPLASYSGIFEVTMTRLVPETLSKRDLFAIDQRLAGGEQRLLVVEEFLRHLAREEIEVGLADRLFGRHAHAVATSLLQAVKRLCGVLGVNECRDQVDHRAQDVALMRQRVLQAATFAADVGARAVRDGLGGDIGKAVHDRFNDLGGKPLTAKTAGTEGFGGLLRRGPSRGPRIPRVIAQTCAGCREFSRNLRACRAAVRRRSPRTRRPPARRT